MNIRDLQYLVAVYDLHSFSKAAESCFVSQPTLSGQLKKLEGELGAPLMERSTRKVLFTQLGEEIVREARTILSTVDHIKQLAKQTDDPMAGDFHIGLIPTIGPFLLPKIITSLNLEYPQMHLFLHELRTEVLIDKLLKGGLDVAILAKLDWDYPVVELPLYSEELMLAVADSDSIAATQDAVSRSVLKQRPVLMLEDGHCLRDQSLAVCFAEGAKEDKRFQATSMNTLLHMVATGAGLTLIPKLAISANVAGVSYLSFKGPVPHREVIMLTRKNYARSEAVRKLADLVRKQVSKAL